MFFFFLSGSKTNFHRTHAFGSHILSNDFCWAPKTSCRHQSHQTIWEPYFTIFLLSGSQKQVASTNANAFGSHILRYVFFSPGTQKQVASTKVFGSHILLYY